ncbi:MAG: HAMP domain-containing sensor histidine kinase [Pseudomonadota bacterium]
MGRATTTETSAPPRAGRLRGIDHVRETRTRMAQGTVIKPEFEYELLSIFVRNELGAIATIPILAVIFALASMFWAPVFEAVIWLAAVSATKFFLLFRCYRFKALDPSEVNVAAWRNKLTTAEFINGLAWASIALVGLQATDPSSHVFIFASLIVVLAIRMTLASAVMPILYAGTIPMTCAVVTRLILLDHPFYWAMASMAIGVHIYFLFLAMGLNSTSLAMLEFRAEKDALIAEIEEEKSISDEARRRAEGANVAKSRFLATMSHELRTPLNAILGFSEVMKTGILGEMENPTYREYAVNIHESGQHLLNLINEILDLSRIEAGRYELHEEPVRLPDIAEDCRRLLKLRAEGKGLHLSLEIQDGLSQIWVDERAVRQICLNLLSNAIKFTPQAGHVTLSIGHTQQGGQFMVVRDTGPGIPADEIPKVLKAFGQGSLAQKTAEGGTGLGLPIVQSLISLHGGTFDLQSELRKGTQVIITFPAKRVLQSLPPLQPLGHERHRQGQAAEGNAPRRPARAPRMRAHA